jgi:hypothetical protein
VLPSARICCSRQLQPSARWHTTWVRRLLTLHHIYLQRDQYVHLNPLQEAPLEQLAAPNAPGHTPAPTPEPPTTNIALEEQVISASAPPISTTRGSHKRTATGGDVPAPHFKRPKQSSHVRRCSKCNKLGHYSTSCGRDAPPPKRPRGRPVGSGRQKTTA